MGLEKLKSIFTEGLKEPKVTDVTQFRATIDEPRYFTFVSNDLLEKKYNTKNYDPRVARPRTIIIKNAYQGTRFDDGVGGIFHSTGTKYSNAFSTITTPKGYAYSSGGSATGNDIIQLGNINTAAGYPNK